MSNKDCNKDEGIITDVNGKTISVHIAQKETCAGCAAANLCEKTSNAGKDFTITQDNAQIFRKGEKVSVLTPQNKALKAIRLAFLYPTLLVIAFCMLQYFFFPMNDIAVALVSILIIALYFLILYINRHKPLFNFSIFVEKLPTVAD
ncbi:MAG: SoxR reducing system RseC family protein [Bacteroidales bacterium]|nr:SoxR reducing system RseC family protein [Bacteroidales bacterium]